MTPDTLLLAAMALVGLTGILAFIRLQKGPQLPDRVIALELVSVCMICLIGIWTIYTDEGWYLDAALVLAILAFVSTVALARYMEKDT
ncbi:MAG: monovalent cation/H+ antiporter complex subunit F [Fimbriimonadaceae bacterium]|nr:monovalent cation/H+ antiporter complex subunit F [Fimbriimonadaceae bacterium]